VIPPLFVGVRQIHPIRLLNHLPVYVEALDTKKTQAALQLLALTSSKYADAKSLGSSHTRFKSFPLRRARQVTYRRFAQDRIRQYHADALSNSLYFDRHEEETNVDTLSEIIIRVGRCYLANPTSILHF
jgi:hypothetical protein